MIREVKVIQCTCERCGKEFYPRTCPACKSPNWNKAATMQGRPKKVAAQPAREFVPSEIIETEETVAEAAPIARQTIREEHPGICPHHKQRGELCYKCDKKFGLPKIKTGK